MVRFSSTSPGPAALMVALLWAASNLAQAAQEFETTDAQRRAARLVTHVAEKYHYVRTTLDDALSVRIFERYLETLDPDGRFLDQADIEALDQHRQRMDDYLREPDLRTVFEIHSRFARRVAERVALAQSLLESDFDFTRDEELVLTAAAADQASTREELDERWRKLVKNDVLSQRLAGKDIAVIRSTLASRYRGLAERVAARDADEVFEIFMNAYLTAFDARSHYIRARTIDTFRLKSELRLVGVGLSLATVHDHTVIREIVPNGPAAKSGALHLGDRIVGIGDGDASNIVDVVGWRLDDVVERLRGERGSAVILETRSAAVGPGGPTRNVRLTRDTVRLEEQAPRLSIMPVDDTDARIGVIRLPSFYLDFAAMNAGEKNYRSSARDIERLLRDARDQPLDGLVLDLRGNGGGSLSEAAAVAGLFIDRGPVIQVRDSQGKVSIESDPGSGTLYAGALAVLIDHNSAGAAEITAAALQDYHRALLVGERSFGHGTVQNLIDLDRFAQQQQAGLGHLNATIAQFFRVQGDSIQGEGVQPDIEFVVRTSPDPSRGTTGENAVPWSRISATRFTSLPALDDRIAGARSTHQMRLASQPTLRTRLEQASAPDDAARPVTVSLMEAARKAAIEAALREEQARETAVNEGDAWLEETARLLHEFAAAGH